MAHTQLLPNFSSRGYGKREQELNVSARSNGCFREKGGGVSPTWGHPTLALRGAPSLDIMTSDGGRLTPDVTRVSLPKARAA